MRIRTLALALFFCATGVIVAQEAPKKPADSLADLSPGVALLAPLARIADDRLDECSGMVFDGNFFWAHNDSGDSARFFRSKTPDFDKSDVFEVKGADAVDWEDMTQLGGDLIACDIGDNKRARDDITLYRVAFFYPKDTDGALELRATYPIAYPDGRHDAEAVFVLDGKIHIVSKARGEKSTNVYRFNELKTAGELGDKRNVGELVGSFELEPGVQITGAALHPGGTLVLLSYNYIFQYDSKKLSGKPVKQTLIGARQCEALCFHHERLVFCNEQRDVYAVDNFLKRDYASMLPQRGNAELPRVAASFAVDGSGATWEKSAGVLPVQNLKKDEHLRWLIAGDQLLVKGRIAYAGTFQSTRTAVAAVGSGLYFAFGKSARLQPTDEDGLFVLGDDGDKGLHLWRVRIEGKQSLSPVTGAVVKGKVAAGALEFEFSAPLKEIFGGDAPATFLFNTFGKNLHGGDLEPRFSGVDDFAARLPYLWGDVTVK
ncbi:MAG: hypothetical protein IT462_12705 [Planctomycetes bacterium]|nr:hypothetical protein [Planctomycetota bacterium]